LLPFALWHAKAADPRSEAARAAHLARLHDAVNLNKRERSFVGVRVRVGAKGFPLSPRPLPLNKALAICLGVIET